MSVRVRFSAERPGVAFVPPTVSPGTGLVAALFAHPMPPVHKEVNFEMDAHTAASIGDVAIMKHLLSSKNSAGPNGKNKTGWTPLLYAAYLGHEAICTLLIESGARLDEVNHKGQTALMLASACGNLSVVRVLLARGASPDRADRAGRLPLHYAATCSQNTVVDELLKAGADPNAADEEGTTAVLEACAAGHELTLISLLDKDGDPYIRNRRGEDGVGLAADTPKILQIIRETVNEKHGGYVVEPSGARQLRELMEAMNLSEPAGARQPSSLRELLEAMNLERYLERLQKENIDLSLFFSLSDKDLEDMHVAYGPKKIMLSVIDRYRQTGVISVEGYDSLVAPFQQPPPYAAIVQPSQSEPSGDALSSIRLVRSENESNKTLALAALESLRTGPQADILRPLLTQLIGGCERIATRLARHPL